jgi:hypothetical protein
MPFPAGRQCVAAVVKPRERETDAPETVPEV